MNIETLRQFYALSSNLSFSKTAEQFFISQPVLSRHIQSIEKELGVCLLIRDKHSVRLTPAGTLFATKVKKLLQDYNDAVLETQRCHAGMESTIKIGHLSATSNNILPKACNAFSSRNPLVDLQLYSMEVDEIISDVQRGALDLGVTLLINGKAPAGMSSLTLYMDPLGIAVRKGHKLASRERVFAKDLKNYELYVPNPSRFPLLSQVSSLVLGPFEEQLNTVPKINDIASVLPYLLGTNNVALIPHHVMGYLGDQADYIPLGNVYDQVHYSAIWKEPCTQQILTGFIQCLEACSEAV